MEIRGDFRTYSKYVSLNVAGMIGTSVYILADTLFVANGIGEIGIASLNLALPIFSLIQGFSFMLGIGGATWYSILRAQNKHEKAIESYTQTFILAVLISFVLVLLGLVGSGAITRLVGADQETFAMTNTYIKVIMLFSPFFILNNLLVAFIRNDRNPKLAMTAMLLGSVLNIIFDYIFIFPLEMGMFGAALATSCAPIFGLLLMSFHFKRADNSLRLTKIKIKLNAFWTIIKLGISSFITEMSSGIVMFIFNILILKIAGNIGLAAYGVISNLAIIAIAIFTGVAQGLQPIISHIFGLRNSKLLKRNLIYGLMTSLSISGLIYLVIGSGSEQLISFFNRDNNPVLAEIGNEGILIYFIGMFFAGFNIIAIACLSAMDQAGLAFRFSIFRSIVLIIPISFILANYFQLTGVWASFVITEAITSGLIIWQLYRVRKKLFIP